jgi:hypothetical protein
MATGKARPKDNVTTAAFTGKYNRGLLRKNRVLQFIKTQVTRYDYNLTIMESPKLATDNRFKK